MTQSSPPQVLAWFALLVTTASLVLCMTIATEVYAMVLAPTPSNCWLSCPDRWNTVPVERIESTTEQPSARPQRIVRRSKKRPRRLTACATVTSTPACS